MNDYQEICDSLIFISSSIYLFFSFLAPSHVLLIFDNLSMITFKTIGISMLSKSYISFFSAEFPSQLYRHLSHLILATVRCLSLSFLKSSFGHLIASYSLFQINQCLKSTVCHTKIVIELISLIFCQKELLFMLVFEMEREELRTSRN